MYSISLSCLSLSLVLASTLFPFSLSSPPLRHLLQSTPSPQNLQTFFPSTAIPAFPTSPPPPSPSPSTPSSPTPPVKASDTGKVATAVVVTAASSFAISGLLFFAIYRFTTKRHRPEPFRMDGPTPPPFRSQPEPTLKGVVIDDNGLDVLYWRSLDSAAVPLRCDYCKNFLRRPPNEEDDLPPPEEPRRRLRKNEHGSQEIPLLPSDSINSTSMAFAAQQKPSGAAVDAPSNPSPPPLLPLKSSPLPSAPPPPPPIKSPPPPPPPAKKDPAAPPPPLVRRVGGPAPPPSVSRPPPAPEGGKERPRLKPLHWDKVTPANAGHSMVWDKITEGSIRFDDDLMEKLFGYVATNRRPNNPGDLSSATINSGAASSSAASPAQIRLLDSRKSQNIAIILRTLAVSRREILDGLHDGHGLGADTLEKLSRIAPTHDEASLILSFTGNPSHLSDAESFLFHILRAVPSAFPRIAALHFRCSTYEPEILHLKLSFQSLQLACKELRTRGLFLKLLEAILKAGNRMNAGTARGNAQAFDLTALRKLSDVKSTDGRTTLLHFVVEEVVRTEGKHCAAINRSRSIRRLASRNGWSAAEQEAHRQMREEREREYMMLGLPIVGGLSVEFTYVKKVAGIDHDSLMGGCTALAARIVEIRQMLGSLKDEEGGFMKEMMGFVEAAAGEIEKVREEQERVMETVRRTTEYYQPGAPRDKATQPLQLFVIVRDFLAMMDQTCVDITRNLQKKKLPPASPSSLAEAAKAVASTSLREERINTRFPNLPARFMSDNSLSSDSEEDGF